MHHRFILPLPANDETPAGTSLRVTCTPSIDDQTRSALVAITDTSIHETMLVRLYHLDAKTLR